MTLVLGCPPSQDSSHHQATESLGLDSPSLRGFVVNLHNAGLGVRRRSRGVPAGGPPVGGGGVWQNRSKTIPFDRPSGEENHLFTEVFLVEIKVGLGITATKLPRKNRWLLERYI